MVSFVSLLTENYLFCVRSWEHQNGHARYVKGLSHTLLSGQGRVLRREEQGTHQCYISLHSLAAQGFLNQKSGGNKDQVTYFSLICPNNWNSYKNLLVAKNSSASAGRLWRRMSLTVRPSACFTWSSRLFLRSPALLRGFFFLCITVFKVILNPFPFLVKSLGL